MAAGNSNNRAGPRIAGEQTDNQHTVSNDADNVQDAGATERTNYLIDDSNVRTLTQFETQGSQTFRFADDSPAPTANCTVNMNATTARGPFWAINDLSQQLRLRILGQSKDNPFLQPGTTKFLNHDGVDVYEVRGQRTFYVPAGQMVSRTTNGPAAGSLETTTNKVMLETLDFDTTTAEYAQFSVLMPKGWDLGTVVFEAVWSHPSTTVNFGVAWALQAVSFIDGTAADTAFGTAVVRADTGGTTDDVYITPESTAITVAGTPGNEEWVVFQIYRDVADGSDNLAVDARLHGVKIGYTEQSLTDD